MHSPHGRDFFALCPRLYPRGVKERELTVREYSDGGIPSNVDPSIYVFCCCLGYFSRVVALQRGGEIMKYVLAGREFCCWGCLSAELLL